MSKHRLISRDCKILQFRSLHYFTEDFSDFERYKLFEAGKIPANRHYFCEKPMKISQKQKSQRGVFFSSPTLRQTRCTASFSYAVNKLFENSANTSFAVNCRRLSNFLISLLNFSRHAAVLKQSIAKVLKFVHLAGTFISLPLMD